MQAGWLRLYTQGNTGILKMKKRTANTGSGEHVLALCHMLSNRISKVFTRELEKYGVTTAEWRVILTVSLDKGVTASDITNRWAMDKMAISRAIASLEAKGLILKRPGKSDRRSYKVTLTNAGRSVYNRIVPMANERYHTLLGGLEKSEEKTLHRILCKLIARADVVAAQTE